MSDFSNFFGAFFGLFFQLFNLQPMTERICLTRNVYWEAALAKQSYISQLMVGYVTKQRADDVRADERKRKKYGDSTICGCVYARRQFSWTFLVSAHHQNTILPGKMWESAQSAADQVLAGWHPGGEWDQARYYLNPRHTPRRNVCRFKKEFKFIGSIEDHDFYRELVGDEIEKRKTEPEPEECRKNRGVKKKKTSRG